MTDPSLSNDALPSAKPSRARKILKWVAIGLGVIVLLAAVAAFGVVQSSKARANEVYPVNPVPVTALTSPEDIEEGARLARARGCADCHGSNLAGRLVVDEMPMMRLIGANITGGQGSNVGDWSDEDIARVIRYGIKPDGKPVFFMPAHEYFAMPPHELGRIIGYMRSVPPVDGDPGRSELGLIGRILHVTGAMPLYPAEILDASVQPPTFDVNDPVAFGGYLADACKGCHGTGLSGGKLPGAPPSMPVPLNITMHETGLAGWTAEEFAETMRTGKSRDGRQLSEFMPFGVYRSMTDSELNALWAYIQTLDPQAFGNR